VVAKPRLKGLWIRSLGCAAMKHVARSLPNGWLGHTFAFETSKCMEILGPFAMSERGLKSRNSICSYCHGRVYNARLDDDHLLRFASRSMNFPTPICTRDYLAHTTLPSQDSHNNSHGAHSSAHHGHAVTLECPVSIAASSGCCHRRTAHGANIRGC